MFSVADAPAGENAAATISVQVCVRVVAPYTHDTACVIIKSPMGERCYFMSFIGHIMHPVFSSCVWTRSLTQWHVLTRQCSKRIPDMLDP